MQEIAVTFVNSLKLLFLQWLNMLQFAIGECQMGQHYYSWQMSYESSQSTLFSSSAHH